MGYDILHAFVAAALAALVYAILRHRPVFRMVPTGRKAMMYFLVLTPMMAVLNLVWPG
ncbi:MAG: hypothetical protein AAGA05_08450 [Pseudomonadota bacterium]